MSDTIMNTPKFDPQYNLNRQAEVMQKLIETLEPYKIEVVPFLGNNYNGYSIRKSYYNSGNNTEFVKASFAFEVYYNNKELRYFDFDLEDVEKVRISDGYLYNDKFVVFQWYNMPYADPASFQILSYRFARDKNHIYCGNTIVHTLSANDVVSLESSTFSTTIRITHNENNNIALKLDKHDHGELSYTEFWYTPNKKWFKQISVDIDTQQLTVTHEQNT